MRYKKKDVDRLSELPNDILVLIISRLSFQEATSTSILSTRWRHVHEHVVSLNFDFALKPHASFHDSPKQKREREESVSEFLDYIRGINHAIDSYKGGTQYVLNAFRVHTPCLGENFYKWLEFALSRKVKIIDLRINCWENLHDCCYYFVSRLIFRSCKKSLRCVKELSLSSICLHDGYMEKILSHFVFLEHLSIDSPRKLTLRDFRVVGHHRLTHLNLSNFAEGTSLKSIEICNMINLVSLRFTRLPDMIVLLLNRVPKLVHFSSDDDRYKLLDNIFPKISCIYRQLLHLRLSIFPEDIERDGLTFIKLINVKHLELKVRMPCTRGDIHRLFPLIEACPSLEKLEIEFSWSTAAMWDLYGRVDDNSVKRKKRNANLKRVKLSGYFGSKSEREFLMYVTNNAVALQEVIIKAWDITPKIRQRAITCAYNHLQFVPVDFVNLRII